LLGLGGGLSEFLIAVYILHSCYHLYSTSFEDYGDGYQPQSFNIIPARRFHSNY
jgi:hypothetical protein